LNNEKDSIGNNISLTMAKRIERDKLKEKIVMITKGPYKG